ncbi:hypothetical protein GCM10009530_72450 [Microbispora corallina]
MCSAKGGSRNGVVSVPMPPSPRTFPAAGPNRRRLFRVQPGMERTTSRTRLAAAAALALVTAACASAIPSAHAGAAGSARAGAVAQGAPTATTSGTDETTVRAASSGAAAARCRTTGLKARVGRVDAGAGQRYAPLVLTNTSSKTCWVYGFVGLIMIDGHGDALRTRTRRESVRPHRVTLRPGASAHARLHWTEIPTGSETRCPASARLMVIPPDEVAHLEIPFTARPCDDGRIDVTPMAAGATI